MKYFAWGAIAFVALAVVGAFFVIGSPAHQRLQRFDELRLSDLQNIQYHISSYFMAKDQLPSVLADLNGFDGFKVPPDPQSGASYEYMIKGPMQFQLCATFALASDPSGKDGSSSQPLSLSVIQPYSGSATTWQHPAGRGCFDFTLEKPVSGANPTLPPAITVKPAV